MPGRNIAEGDDRGSDDVGLDDGIFLEAEGTSEETNACKCHRLGFDKRKLSRMTETLREGMMLVVRLSFITILLNITPRSRLIAETDREVEC
ncbi:hypothetical protein ZIOFF_022139 [Zingiber officinale]|uniref:Uncharacterized protein n=1 Tax=Zingiber officinale TaxID=94328 RepID=A0A8J5LMI9_ZINOF|nr:hypothetical protein ZIOFF_022139 [Zingiber officinale]